MYDAVTKPHKTGCLIEIRPVRISGYARSIDAVNIAGTDKEEWHIKHTHKLLRRMTVWVVTAAMLLTSLPLVTVPVEAYDGDTPPKTTSYTVKTTVANERNAKTDNDVYCIVKDARGHEHSILLDKKGDDFQKGETDEYTFTLDLYPWEIHAVGFQHKSGADAVKLEKFSFWANVEGKQHWFIQDKVINTWFHKYKKTYSVMSATDREVTLHGFDEVFGDWEYYDPEVESAGDTVLAWDGTAWDQYYYSYNFFKADPGAVGIEFSSSGKSYNGRSSFSTAVLTGNDNKYAVTGNINGMNNQITLKTGEILKYMRENQIYKFTLTSKLDYLYDYDAYGEHSKTFTIIRKGFDLGSPTAITKAYTPFTDQNFYNSNAAYNTFEIKIPVLSFDHYNASSIASSLAANIKNGTVPARVYYGATGTSDYVVPTDAYSQGSDVYLKCKTPSGYNNPDGMGITVQLDQAKATYNYTTYWLDHQVSASDTNRSRNYSEYISTHKVDTAGVALAAVNTDGSDAASALNTYQKTHTFKLQSSENNIFLENSNGTRSQGYFSYQLLSADGKTVKALKNYKTAPTTKVPYATNAVYTVEPKDTLEGDYQLRITTRDIANNPTTVTYPIKIDTIAPRAKYSLKQLTPIDGSRRNEYTFTIEDATGTGKLYYCIVPDGETMSAPGNDIPEHTGTVESQYNRWSFINQSGAAKTAVVSVPKGQYFEGTLYWYTVDAAGNDSRTEKIKGTNAGGYFYTDITINNIDAECNMVVEDSTPGRPFYMISFDTNVNNRVEYQWRSATVTTKKSVYSANYNPGASMQTLANGGSIVMNGEYTLEYTVITPDGTSKSYSEKFLFDNNAPVVKMSDNGDAVAASKTMTVEVSDITNITKLTYQLHKADGAAVGEPVALNCGLPVVTADLMLEPEVPGMYYVTVTAVDVNGQTSMQTSEVFGIRNGQPVQILGETVDFHIETYGSISYKDSNNSPVWIGTEYNGIPLTNQRTLTYQWKVIEPMENVHLTDANNAAFLKENYVLFCRFSADGINYGAWEKMKNDRGMDYIASKDDHLLETTIEVTNPIVLREGENRIWIQAAFAQNGTDPATIRPEMIATNNDCVVILDVTAPEYTFEIDSMEPTANSVFGTVVFSDAYSSLDDMKWSVYSDEASGYSEAIVGKDITAYPAETPAPTEGESTETDSSAEVGAPAVSTEKTLRLEIFRNGTHSVVLTDKAGNSVQIEIPISCIDREAPTVEVDWDESVSAGYRQDHQLQFTVEQALDEKILFALVDCDLYTVPATTYDPTGSAPPQGVNVDPNSISDDLFGPIPEDGKIGILEQRTVNQYNNGETDIYYDIIIYADEEKADDTLNTNTYALIAKTEDALGNTSKSFVGKKVESSYYGEYYAGITLINATPKIFTDSISCYPQKAYKQAVLSMRTNVPVYVLPANKIPEAFKNPIFADGRMDDSKDSTINEFAELIADSATQFTQNPVYVIGGNGDIPVYFADEAGRVYKQTVTALPSGQYEEGKNYDKPTVKVDFGNIAPVSAQLYQAASASAEKSTWSKIDSLDAFDPEDGYVYYVEFTPTDSVDPSGKTVTAGKLYNNGAFISRDAYYENDFTFQESYSVPLDDAYSSMVYSIGYSDNVNRTIAFNVGVSYVSGEETVTDTAGYVYELVIQDMTAPESEILYSTNEFTNQPVDVTVSAYDFELATHTDATDTGATDNINSNVKTFTASDIAAKNGIDNMAITAPLTEKASDVTILTYEDIGQISETTLTFTENGYAYVKITNLLGLVSYAEICVQNINTTPIGAEDYSVTYSVSGQNSYSADSYYDKVAVSIGITESGMAKGVAVVNNGGKPTKNLTAGEREFTFTLRDKYGNETDVNVAHQKFDTTAPVFGTTTMDTAKTNDPIDVTLRVAENESRIASVSVMAYPYDGTNTSDATYVSTEEVDDVSYGLYTVKVPQSGIYLVTATDNSGNTAETTFTVSNIDTTLPGIVDKKYTVNTPTRNEVGVKLYYNKPNVALTGVDIVSGVNANELSVNYNESILRFYNNGSVSVKFVDEYGNVGYDVVTVNNISRIPPNLKAVVELAEGDLSANVTFQFADPTFQGTLANYYVVHSGVTPMEFTYDDKGNPISERVLHAGEVSFKFIENGKYDFYAYDSLGNMQKLNISITGIDRKPPTIQTVAWSYSYIDANGSVQTMNQTVTPGTEAGYSVVEDANNPATNQDITASVTTDKGTKFAGSDAEYGTEHSVVYDSDGWFNFDMVSPNGLMDSYGLGLYLIDKEAPIIEGAEDLMFFENARANAPFDLSLLAVTAYDERYGKTTDLTDQIKYSYTYNGETTSVENFADLAAIGDLPYDKSKPITVTYTVCDSVGNEASVRRTVTLVGLFDTTIRVNGGYTDANGMIEVDGSSVTLALDNFAGLAWARYESGIYTMGQMKNKGTVIAPQADGTFKLDRLSEGWYTFYVQTDLRDYFCVKVYVFAQ